MDPGRHEKDQQSGEFGFPAAKVVAVILAIILFSTYCGFKSNTLIGDGLRYLPVFRTIAPGAPPTIQAKPWTEVYRHHYNDLVVHNHFLFGVAMWTAFAMQQKLGISGDAAVAIQFVNSLCAAIAAALFFLLGLRLGLSPWVSLGVTLGFALSPVYLLAATNITEVALALPFFVGTLLLTDRELSGWKPMAAGGLAGLAAIFYGIAGFVAPGIVAALILPRFRSRSAWRSLFLFVVACGIVFGGIWVAVLIASGYRSVNSLTGAIFQFPQQGTFIKFKSSSFLATAVGLTQGFLPVLPDDFTGLQSLWARSVWPAVYVGAATLFVCAFLAGVFYALYKRGSFRDPLALSCVLSFVFVEAACVKWDTYYQKLHLFAVILCWVMILIALSKSQSRSFRWLAIVFVSAVCLGGFSMLRKNIEPSQARANAQQLQQIVGNGELITTWSDDVMHMCLYSNADNVVSLPELGFASRLDSQEAKEKLETMIQQARAQGRSVYFYELFDEKNGGASEIFETRFREGGMTAYLNELRQRSKAVVSLPQQAGGSIPLYLYVP